MSLVVPGTVIDGKYRVERTLGTGGMGYVVAARHLKLDQIVALKFMRPGVLDGDEAKARFYREAKASARLRSEHVARVLDVGTLESGDPYMVMEYLEGKDLSVIARERGQLSIQEASDYVLQACDALAEAHAMGVVHRDIKLANLFITSSATGMPFLKVLDFGISKASPFGNVDVDVTSTAAMLGSPRFMSPEQMRDPRDVDARSDVWSLGVILYRLTAGKAPFDSETLGRLFSMVMHEVPPPIRSIAPHLPIDFEMLVMHCLVKEREGRVQNVADLAHGLTKFASNPQRALQIAEKAAMVLSVPRGISSSGAFAPPTSQPGSHPGPLSNASGAYGAQASGGYGAFNASVSASGNMPMIPRMPSGPPGASETGGEGAAWGATNARSPKKKSSSRGPIFVTLGLLTAAIALGGLAIRAKYIQQETAQAANPGIPSDLPRMDIPVAAPPPNETNIPTTTVDNLPKADDVKKSADGSKVKDPLASSGGASSSGSAKGGGGSASGSSSGSSSIGASGPTRRGGGATNKSGSKTGTATQTPKPGDEGSGGIPNSRD